MERSFWDEPYSGEPSQWSRQQLETWIEAADDGFTSGMGWRFDRRAPTSVATKSELVRQVTTRLDALYVSFRPTYMVDLEQCGPKEVEQLPPWTRAVPGELDNGRAERMLMTKVAGPLERGFNGCVSMHEKTACRGNQMPVGLHPLDDLRQNMIIIVKALDEDAKAGGSGRGFIMQDMEQTEGCILSVRDVRLLPPGGRLKPGSAVVLLRGGWVVLRGLKGKPADSLAAAAVQAAPSPGRLHAGAGVGLAPGAGRVDPRDRRGDRPRGRPCGRLRGPRCLRSSRIGVSGGAAPAAQRRVLLRAPLPCLCAQRRALLLGGRRRVALD